MGMQRLGVSLGPDHSELHAMVLALLLGQGPPPSPPPGMRTAAGCQSLDLRTAARALWLGNPMAPDRICEP
jgi:hypothetical protein